MHAIVVIGHYYYRLCVIVHGVFPGYFFFFKRSLRIFDIVLRDAIALELGFGFFLLSASVVIAINNAARHYRLSVPGTHIWTCLQSH